MDKFLTVLTNEVMDAFERAGYDRSYGKVGVSNRPDLCEFQCNGALAAAKAYHKAPFMIAEDVEKELAGSTLFAKVETVKPGFLNMDASPKALLSYLNSMDTAKHFGYEMEAPAQKIILDYGGPNVAKPLHVGHLRSAVIGESIKRILRYAGHEVIGDVHLGDWGLQMGLIIEELKNRRPELVYFDESYEGEYPQEAPFTISELEEIYPAASAKSKEDAAFKDAAMQATYELQHGRRGYQALLSHIMHVSVTDLKKNYDRLSVTFDLWKGESDAQPYIPDMVQKMKDDGFAYISDGALVVDVKEETDTKEVPPCMILKSDGASLYNTTDLATLVMRMQDYNPDHVIYVVDKRQELYFTQVFRCAKKTGIVPETTDLTFIGFGTMNGKDGKPFKTREGGVMRLETLLTDIQKQMYQKISENDTMTEDQAKVTSEQIALAAIKYGDLSNQASKDYIFDVEKFSSFEGNTGPYILYTIVRIKSILRKYEENGNAIADTMLRAPQSESEKKLMLAIAGYGEAIDGAVREMAPHRICAYIYDLANALNHFYHETRILAEEDKEKQKGYIALLKLTVRVLESGIDLLGFDAPEKM